MNRYFQDLSFALAHEHVEIYLASRLYFARLNSNLQSELLAHSELKELREFFNPKEGIREVFHISIEKNDRALKRSHPQYAAATTGSACGSLAAVDESKNSFVDRNRKPSVSLKKASQSRCWETL